MKTPTFLIGYDVEAADSPGTTESFLKVAGALHQKLNAPASLFICGQVLEQNVSAFQQFQKGFKDLFDLQQHTYSHMLLKTVVEEVDDRSQGKHSINIYKSGTPDQIREEIQKTNQLLKEYLGVNCLGMTTPYGAYRGLSDRLDLLAILHESGLRFVRSYARNENDWFPVSLDRQPFWYELQGFPDIFECLCQGWADCVWRGYYGWDKKTEYLQYIKQCMDYVIKHNLTWSYCQHDWSSIQEDPKMDMTRQIIQYAQERGVRIMTYLDYYRECLPGSDHVDNPRRQTGLAKRKES